MNETDTIAVRIADFNLVGNQWQKAVADQADTTFEVTVVNVEDNPTYQSPPFVIRERDRTRPEEEVYANEQSLALVVKDLPAGQSRQAVKFYTYRALDLFNYKTMKMFMHGDENFVYVDENKYDAEFYFRFGLDSLNYYEYRAPIHKGWDGQNEVLINFEELTAVKQARDSVRQDLRSHSREGRSARVGLPRPRQSVTDTGRLSRHGDREPDREGDRPSHSTGEVWLDELRLTSVDDTPGWAYRFDTQVKLADLGTVSFNYSHVDPNFHTLEAAFRFTPAVDQLGCERVDPGGEVPG